MLIKQRIGCRFLKLIVLCLFKKNHLLLFPETTNDQKEILMHLKKLIVFLLILGSVACQKKIEDVNVLANGFEAVPLVKPLLPGILDEASGITDSKINPGFLWVQQDSGNPGEIALLSHDGTFFKKISINAAVNRDWEDMVIANGPAAGTSYVYIADIGDNNLAFSQYSIYRFSEPATIASTVTDYDKITFQYPDGPHNSEAILVDNNTKDIYIITKGDSPSKIYKISYPQNTSSVNTAVYSGALTFNDVTAAAISPDGKEMLVKNYTSIYHWDIKTGESIENALLKTPTTVSYLFEPQGEAICFKNDNSGFFTLSERPAVIAAVNLNFYKRK